MWIFGEDIDDRFDGDFYALLLLVGSAHSGRPRSSFHLRDIFEGYFRRFSLKDERDLGYVSVAEIFGRY